MMLRATIEGRTMFAVKVGAADRWFVYWFVDQSDEEATT